MITSVCESLGGFIGDAFVTPVFQGGTLLTIIVFMFVQDPVLGAAAVALYPVQGYAIPKLQRKVNQLGKRRVRTVREVADRVHESAAGIVDIHAHDAVKRQLTVFAHLLGTIYDIRFEIYQRKFFVKFLNNFIAQLTPFFFYSIGGYLVICGNLSFGALVAVLAAYKDLASPWKELLDFYQIKEDSRIKYEQIVEQFQPAGMIDARLQMAEPQTSKPLSGELSVVNLAFAEEDGSRVLDSSFARDHRTGRQREERTRLVARPLDRTYRWARHNWRARFGEASDGGDRAPDWICRRGAILVRRHSARQFVVRSSSHSCATGQSYRGCAQTPGSANLRGSTLGKYRFRYSCRLDRLRSCWG